MDAVPCKLFSGFNSLLTGKFTGNFVSLAEAFCYKSPPESTLAGNTRFSRSIGTGNDQGRNRESKFPVLDFREMLTRPPGPEPDAKPY